MSGLPIAFDDSGSHGRARLEGPAQIAAGDAGTWTLVFTVGPNGLSAGGALACVRRWPSDWDTPQRHTPNNAGYTTVTMTSPCRHRWRNRRAIEWHPFDHAFELEFLDPLPPGATVAIRFGDRAGGGPGLRAQTFIEEASPLSIRVRNAEASWTEIAVPTVQILGGAPFHGDLVIPSDAVVGEAFEIAYRVEDQWGNPAILNERPAIVGATCEPLPDQPGVKRWLTQLDTPGSMRLTARGVLGECLSNPVVVHAEAPERRIHWGDIHAQCVIGCGARSIDAFFAHARDFARLDFASHQANCFLVSGPEWLETQQITARHDSPGSFVTLLGLEWSADTDKGGDRNLYFPTDATAITRCSHEYVEDKTDLASDLPQAEDLHAAYQGADVVIALHVGGRTTDLSRHEPALERLIEVHSTHATSEWFLFEALRRGYRMGVTAGSDGVDGRPGASHPGHQTVRNVRGGLVAAPLSSLSREGLWEALKARRCYATNGPRIRLEFSADGHPMGSEFASRSPPTLSINVKGTAPLEEIHVFRGTDLIHAVPLTAARPELSDQVRIAWRGATAPGNFSKARMNWDGFATLSEGRFSAVAGYAFDTPDEGVTTVSERRIEWRSMTGGDWDGVIACLDAPDEATLTIETPQISCALTVASLADGPARFSDLKPNRELEIRRLPKSLGPLSWHGEFRDPAPVNGWNAYWVRARQWDGGYLWSSPIFVQLPESAAT